jgi:hypothetical protein
LYKDSTPLVTLFAENITGGDGLDQTPPVPLLAPFPNGCTVRNAVGSYGSTPWTTVDYSITEPGNYTLVARAANTRDSALSSHLGLDDLQFLGPAEISANAGSGYTVPAGGSIKLRGFGTVVGPHDVLYRWDLHYDGENFESNALGQSVTFDASDLTAGTVQTVALQVSDGTNTVIDTTTVTVTGAPPVFGMERPGTIPLGAPLNFQLPFTDPGATSYTAKIDYGDGEIDTLTNVQLAGTVPIYHIFKQDGSHLVKVALTDNSGASSEVSFEVIVTPVLANIDVGEPITVQTGTMIDRTITFTFPLVENWTVSYDPTGTGNLVPFPGTVTISNIGGNTNSFDFNTTYAQPGTYNVEFSLDNGFDPPQDVFLPVNVFAPNEFAQLNNTCAQPVVDSDGPTETNTVTGSALDGSTTLLNASLGAGVPVGSSVFTASYSANPFNSGGHSSNSVIQVSGSSPQAPTAFFDVRASFVGPVANPLLTCVFTLEVNPGQNLDDLNVLYDSGTKPDGSPIWAVFVPDPLFPVTRTVVGTDPVTNKEIVQIQVVYDANSTPSVSALQGTVFTIGLPAPPDPPTTTPVTGPTAFTFGVPPATSLTTAFSSDSGGTFILSVSQATNFSASRTEASTGASSSVTAGASWNDGDNANPVGSADESWYLRALTIPEDPNAAQPDAPAPQNQPMPPAPPEEAKESKAPAPKEALSAVFADESFENPDKPAHGYDVLRPKPAPLIISEKTRARAAWALWSASAATGFCAKSTERKRRKLELEMLPVS